MNIIIHEQHVQDDGESQTQRFTQTQRTDLAVIGRRLCELCAPTRFTHSGHIIRFMLQCKLAPRLSGYIIPAPSLKSTEDGDGNWRIYVSWHGFLAHCPPSLSHPESLVVYAAVFNPINLKLTALYNPYPLLLFALFSCISPISLLFRPCTCPRPLTVGPLVSSTPSLAPLCRKVEQLFSSAPVEELLYSRWAFEHIINVLGG